MLVFLSVRDVCASTRIPVLLRKAEVNDVHKMRRIFVRLCHDKVAGLDITVNKVARVDVLDTRELQKPGMRRQHCSSVRRYRREGLNKGVHFGTPSAKSRIASSDGIMSKHQGGQH